MPTFAELISQFSYLASTPAAAGALLAAALIVILPDWRLSVFLFAAQAVFAGLLFSQILPPQVAGVKMMVGLLISLQLFVTGQQIERRRKSQPSGTAEPPPVALLSSGLPFRIVAAIMVVLVGWQLSLSSDIALPDVSADVGLATFGLVGLGLLGLGLSEEPLKAGMYLLTVLMGFELYYAAVEPALAVMALLAAMDFSVALGACYLAAIRSLPVGSATK